MNTDTEKPGADTVSINLLELHPIRTSITPSSVMNYPNSGVRNQTWCSKDNSRDNLDASTRTKFSSDEFRDWFTGIEEVLRAAVEIGNRRGGGDPEDMVERGQNILRRVGGRGGGFAGGI